MRALILFVILILSALLLSALINYPVYLLLKEGFSPRPENLINTTGKFVALPGFILLLRHYSIADKAGLGYKLPRKAFIIDLLKGLGTGLAILLVLAAALLLLGIRVPKPITGDLGDLLAKTLTYAVVGGVIIGFIEETFFRGGLFAAIRTESSFLTTALLSSLLYAWMHFIDPPALPAGEPVTWSSGLQILTGTFDEYLKWRTLDSFIALFVLGLYLALVRERTGNIAYVIGLHAGFVMVIKTLRKLTYVDEQNPLSFLVGYYDGTIGYLSAAGLLIHLIFVYYFWRRPTKE